MKSKNIALVINNAFEYAGTENICNFMSDCLGEKNRVTIYSLQGEGEPFYKFEKVTSIINFKNHKRPMLSLLKTLKSHNPDIVFVISMGKLSVVFKIMSWIMLLKFNDVSCEHVSITSYPIHIKVLKIFFLRFYNKVVVLTDRDRKFLSKWKVNATRIFNPIKNNQFTRNCFNNKFLAVGRLETQKGFERLLYNWSLFKRSDYNSKLTIVGSGSLEEALKQLALKYKIQQSVTFLGKINDMESIYKEHDVFLMTSLYEGLPMVLLEAKSWAMPVVAYDCPTGPKEIISNNVDGYLIKDSDSEAFVDKMKSFSVDKNLYLQFSRNTVSTSKKFSMESIKNEWIMLIN